MPSSLRPTALRAMPSGPVVLREIRELAQNRSTIRSMAQRLLDSIGPRLTGSPRPEDAQAWAASLLESWGCDADVEAYGTWEGWDRGPSHGDLVAPWVRALEGRILAWSPGTGGDPVEGPVTCPPGLHGPGDWDAFLGTVEGRWVMMSEASGALARWLARVPAQVTGSIDESVPGTPSSGGTDHAAFLRAPAPAFDLGALDRGCFDHTWHTHRDTFDKLVFDDLRNSAVLVASLPYLAAEDEDCTSRARRDLLPPDGLTCARTEWRRCQPAVRSSDQTSRME